MVYRIFGDGLTVGKYLLRSPLRALDDRLVLRFLRGSALIAGQIEQRFYQLGIMRELRCSYYITNPHA